MPGSGDITHLLMEIRSGSRGAEAELMSRVYAELRRIAGASMRRERPDHTLQPTELVNEAYLRLVGQQDKEWQNRAHFFAVAAQVMRRILVDYARARITDKRGGGAKRVNIDEIQVAFDMPSEELLALHEALERLKTFDPRQGQVVELRIFGGMTEDEIAEVVGTSSRTVKRDWRLARAWLFGQLKSPGSASGEK
ncbi:MAG: sigma-70 family RNA polymerase sigma factor [Candidatus Solibacter sp.]